MRCPSGLKATPFTVSVCPVRGSAAGLSGGGVPESDGVVAAGGGEEFPVRTEGDVEHLVGVSGEGWAVGLSGGGVPESDGVVGAGGGEGRPVGAEGDGSLCALGTSSSRDAWVTLARPLISAEGGLWLLVPDRLMLWRATSIAASCVATRRSASVASCRDQASWDCARACSLCFHAVAPVRSAATSRAARPLASMRRRRLDRRVFSMSRFASDRLAARNVCSVGVSWSSSSRHCSNVSRRPPRSR